MRKLERVAIVVAAIGCLATAGAGVSFADGYGPQANAWAVSAAGASSSGGERGDQEAAPQAAPQATAPQAAPQAAQQAPAPQAAPQPVQQAPAPQAAPQVPVQQAPAPQAAPQAPMQQIPVQQAPAPQVAPQATVQQAPAQQSAEKRHEDVKIAQHTMCRSHDMNLNVLGQVGLLNGVLGNALNGEGSPGKQGTHQGSRMGCNNSALNK
ncbi:hypothetical protein SAZ_32025 [Streptomyces noursei ZPM]|uniref:Uncharacterized protein n=2 Tax=Streptomyces TaxID=1883 RepID=A0A401R9N3_STRNR|nr:hypothetical protein [Streptomyces noursei]AKA06554.1 hypothetical protein SAZ_32025 [Streptomyces noursei ZPM]EOT01293.1 hypothetical protein K530_24528 [Streptomyces noursei CCRC 11814]EXU87188.1 hypothetical protein P354_37555 [Streptomyces noursei PD-1]GCB94308.1 hypothetical protein SALB_07107 [Streptomyces noursei]